MNLSQAIEFFKSNYACKPAIRWLKKQKKARRGLRYAIENCDEVDWLEWGAGVVDWEAYWKAIKPHRKAYYEATAPHWKAYEGATPPHRKAYDKAKKIEARKILLSLLDKP